eukprot:m.1137724 g.1137724  ORF g.1137724 m.1137724 type:complete len:62 (-) comp24437_c0_seq5:2143-2328(-)
MTWFESQGNTPERTRLSQLRFLVDRFQGSLLLGFSTSQKSSKGSLIGVHGKFFSLTSVLFH